MKKLATLMALVAVAGLMLMASPNDAEARPAYVKAASKKYEKAAAALKEKKCGACHGGEPLGKNKKLLSDYAKVLKEAIGKKNQKDADKIMKALDKAGAKENKDGKKYSEIFESGKLPAPAEAK